MAEEEVGGQRSEALLTGNRKMFTFGRIVKWLLPLRGNRSHFSHSRSSPAPPACGAGALQLPGGGGGGGRRR